MNAPVVGMARLGAGYLLVGGDGGVFNFSDRPFAGSLGGAPPDRPSSPWPPPADPPRGSARRAARPGPRPGPKKFLKVGGGHADAPPAPPHAHTSPRPAVRGGRPRRPRPRGGARMTPGRPHPAAGTRPPAAGRRRAALVAVLVLALVAGAAPAAASAGPEAGTPTVRLVQVDPGALAAAADAVVALGGRPLPPAAGRRHARRRADARPGGGRGRAPGVVAVAADARVELAAVAGYDPGADPGVDGLDRRRHRGPRPVEDGHRQGRRRRADRLRRRPGPRPRAARGKVVNGPDLSFESQQPPTCATSTPSATARTWPASSPAATPAAARRRARPASRRGARRAAIVSLKVAAADGATDVSQVIAAIDWVVAAPQRPGPEHPGAEPVLRHRLDPGRRARPAGVRRRAGLAARASSWWSRPATTAPATGS